ncbi:MAG TPA: hypothetical protein GXZ90_02710 [Clostridiales bacterium]|nr:hypothetical protein [Clostridiales bacterium]
MREVSNNNIIDIKLNEKANIENKTKNETQGFKSEAAVYTKSANSNRVDSEIIDKLKAESENRANSLREMVEKSLLKQGEKYNSSMNIYHLIRDGKVKVDPETRAQAQKDIEPGGYWSVEETSNRLVAFAKAIAGNDPQQADKMIRAIEKGFDMATKAWGAKLPQISHDTLAATKEKLQDWRNSIKE